MTITENTTFEARYSPQCPTWCTSNGYEHEENTHVTSADRKPVIDHEGPSFGRFYVTGTEFLISEDALRIEIHDDSQGEEFTASDLRKLAADALAAAEWLEGQA